MFDNKYSIVQDIQTIRELNDLSQDALAKKLSVATSTLERWEMGNIEMSATNMENFYTYAFKSNVALNKIKTQFYREEFTNEHQLVLFHGAKSELEGNLQLQKSKLSNDFGQGFYCGESFEQSSLFVSAFSSACIYILTLDLHSLSCMKFQVDQEWMLTIAYFRGRLQEYEQSTIIKTILKKLSTIDYIIAPIADNRMFQIIDSFINGEITDIQCKHCLAATNLGFQYVFRSEKALKKVELLERCYLCSEEKKMYLDTRNKDHKISEDKIKIARKQYRGKGQYIDEILI